MIQFWSHIYANTKTILMNFRFAGVHIADTLFCTVLSSIWSPREAHNVATTGFKKQFGLCRPLGEPTYHAAFKGTAYTWFKVSQFDIWLSFSMMHRILNNKQLLIKLKATENLNNNMFFLDIFFQLIQPRSRVWR